MEPDKAFDDFVKRQVSEKEEEEKFDPAEELRYWLNSLDKLYTLIRSFLGAVDKFN